MAGNKKARRKPGKVKPLDVMLAQAKADREKRIATKNARIRKIDSLPLGHPMNVHRIDLVFRPLERLLDEQEQTGSLLFNEDGQAVIYDEFEQDYMLLVPSLMDLCGVFDMVAKEKAVWGSQPMGLRAFALKLASDRPLDNTDVVDARKTVAWMRERVALVSAKEWTRLHDQYLAMKAAESEAAQ